jgi:hypothetical protein
MSYTQTFFAKAIFVKWNKFLFNILISGVGALNYRTEILKGEFCWLKT